MPKGIKKSTKIVVTIVAVIVLIMASVPILLQNSKIQNYIADKVVKELSSRLKSKVSVGDVNYRFFNTIKISDLYVEDLENDTLLHIDHTYANFSLRMLFKSKVMFTSLEFDKLTAHLKVDTLGHTNLDFVIKAFEKKNTNDSSSVEYRINKLEIRNSHFTYSKQNGKPTLAANVLNPDSLSFSNLNTTIILNVFKKDSLNVEVPKISFTERSGLKLQNLATKITASSHAAKIDFLKILLPESNIVLNNIELKYDSIGSFKDFANKVKWSFPLQKSEIAFNDIIYFLPKLNKFEDSFFVKGLLSGRLSSLKFQDVELKYGKSLQMNADLDLSGLPNLEETFIYAQINEIKADKSDVQDIISKLSRKPFVLPKELNQLGTINYKGNITGFFSNLVAYGNMTTNIGSLSTDILLKLENELKDLAYNGTIKTNNLKLGKLLNNNKFGDVSFEVNTNGAKKQNQQIKGTVKANIKEFQFNGYRYSDVRLDGQYDGTGFNGSAALNDENISAEFLGVIDLTQKLPIFDFDLHVKKLDLYALHLIPGYKDAELSFVGQTNMVGNSLDNINGNITFDSIAFTNKDKTLNVDAIRFLSRTGENYSNFSVASDFLNGSFSGNFKYSTVGKTINNIIQNYLPSLAHSGAYEAENANNRIDIDLKMRDVYEITEVLELPYRLSGIAQLKGTVDEQKNKIDISGIIPFFSTGKQKFENITLEINNPKNELKLTTRALMHEKSGLLRMYLLAGAAHDSISTQLGWQNSQEITNAGEIQTVTKVWKEGGKTAARMSVLPTQIIVSDSVWNIRASKIDLNADSTINIRNFKIENNNQFVYIDGKISKSQQDSLTVNMNHLNLDYVMQLVKLKGISIGGIVTGKVTLFSLLKQPIYLANLDVKQVSLNRKVLADAHVFSTWDSMNKRVLLGANFFKNNNDTVAVAYGAYIPKRDSIDVTFDVHNMSIEFLQQYFAGVADNVKGNGSGKLRMYGPMKGIGFEGDVFVDKGQASIAMLNTTYYFNDTVHLSRKSIEMRNIRIFDKERNQGTLNGLITHSGLFTGMHYNVNIKARNMLAMDTKSEDNDYFFGKAYATGTVNIFGDDKEANILVNAVSQPRTEGFIQMGGASTASDNSFISFISPDVKKNTEEQQVAKQEKSTFNVKVDLQLEVTPDALMELIVDPRAGDVISGRGNGNLRVQFDTFSDMKLYGTYTIDNGYYLFTLQTVIRKEFKIDKGSTIAWTGDPFGAKVDIRALYGLSASLSDLSDEISNSADKGNIPVNCVLKLTDDLMKPTIKFEIDLPSSDEGRKQQVKSIINTEEMMNRQIAYLLVLSKFYTPLKSNTTNTNAGWDQTLSFATSTLSSHVNNWVQKSLNTNNFSIGFDWQKSQTYQDEIKAQLNYQPNKRIILNGNIGYRNDNIATSTNSNKIIGDIDFEYLLTNSGKLRFKFYSHTIDRYQLKEANSTQGLGLAYKEDFESVGDMINYYWQLIKNIGKKKKNENSTVDSN